MSTVPHNLETDREPVSSLDRQAGQLVSSLDTLFRRMMERRPSPDEPAPEISREGWRAMFQLHAHGPMNMSDLAEALGVPLSTATHTVDRLVAEKLVLRSRSVQDRRVVHVEVSDHGKRLHELFRRKQRQMARSWLVPLTPGEREIFVELMEKIGRLARPGPQPDPE